MKSTSFGGRVEISEKQLRYDAIRIVLVGFAIAV